MTDKTLTRMLEKTGSNLKETASQIPPHDLDAEQALLGSMLLNPELMDDIMELSLKWNDFYRPAHQRIFVAMMDMHSHGTEVDHLTLKNYLNSNNQLEMSGGAVYLLDLASAVPTTSHWRKYAKIIIEKSTYRKMIAAGTHITSIGYEAPDGEGDDAVALAMSMVNTLALDNETGSKDVGNVVDEFLGDLHSGKKDYITPPGLPDVLMERGDLVVAAAGTSVGKTAITLDWANEWSKTHRVAYFEYEMPEKNLIARLICKEAGVTMRQIRDKDLSAEESSRIDDAASSIRGRHLLIEEVWCDAATLFAKIRKTVQRSGTDIVIIDHLGLIPFTRGKGMNEAKAIGVYLTGPLKRLAAELGIRIVLLVQLNREGQRDGSFPRMHHLRDSGEIEQDAAIVLTLWSERLIKDDWTKRIEIRERSGIVSDGQVNDDSFYVFRVGVEKNRNGPVTEAYALYYGEYFRFDYRNEEVSVFKQGALV